MTVSTGGTQRLADVLDRVPPQYRKICFSLPQETCIVTEGKRHTKIVATIGPATASEENMLRLAAEGVNLVRLNMSHGSYAWHRKVLEIVRKINIESPFVVGTMVDIGSLDMVRLGEFSGGLELEKGGNLTLTTRHEAAYPPFTSEVSYDGFLNVVEVGDLIQIRASAGLAEVVVKTIDGKDAVCEVTQGGRIFSRAAIAIRGKSYQLLGAAAEDVPCEVDSGCHPITDIEFAVGEGVDYISLSFVENAEPIIELKKLLAERNVSVGIVAKVESANALGHLEEIVQESDAVMVARGDLGTAIPYEKVPVWQEKIVRLCRELGKPSLVSTHFLESMVVYPTPTRAEVTDIAEAVRQTTDGLVLTSETASGKYPFKALATMDAVARRIEEQLDARDAKVIANPPLFKSQVADEVWATSATKIAENIASSAALLADRLRPKAILVFTQKGLMASLLSRTRPKVPVFAFTAKPRVRSRLAMLYGVRPFRVTFDDEPEVTIANALAELRARQLVENGDQILIVADMLGGSHGARLEDIQRVFDDIAASNGTGDSIPRSLLRPALRRLGLKASDAVETAVGMSEADYVMSEAEGGFVDQERVKYDAQLTFEQFQSFIDEAVEIVHTVQLRTVE